jgi:hypothetical protein
MRSMRAVATLLALVPAMAGAQAAGGAQPPKPPMQHDMSKMGEQAKQSGEQTTWKELDAFHNVMAAAWHPVMSGDLKPAREKAADLQVALATWRRSRGPAACQNETMRTSLADLASDLRSYADAVKREASDDAVRVTLKRVHDSFETVAEPCMAAAKKP